MEVASRNGIETSFREFHRPTAYFVSSSTANCDFRLANTAKISNNNFVASFACQKLFDVHQNHRRSRQSLTKRSIDSWISIVKPFRCATMSKLFRIPRNARHNSRDSFRVSFFCFPPRAARESMELFPPRMCVNGASNRALLLLRTINKLLSFLCVFFSQSRKFSRFFYCLFSSNFDSENFTTFPNCIEFSASYGNVCVVWENISEHKEADNGPLN